MNKLVSYAQNFEDVILWRALGHIKAGCYVDIGANDPVLDSVSLAFYEHGWRGVHVEPVRAFADRLRGNRPNEVVIEAAVSTTPGAIELYDFPDTGLSTASVEVAAIHRGNNRASEKVSVSTITLKEVLNRAGSQDIHWLKIDVEGAEADVLTSWGNSEVRPWIVVVESTLPNSQTESFADWEPSLVRRGYQYAYFDGLNRFYVHQAHAELSQKLVLPPNYFDHFAIGEHSPFVVDLRAAKINAEDKARLAENRAAEVQRLAAVVDQHYKNLTVETDRLREHIDHKNNEITQLSRQASATENSLNEALATIQSQASSFQTSTAMQQQLLSEVHARLDQKNAELSEAHSRSDDLGAKLSKAMARSDDMSSKLSEASGREQALLQRAGETHSHIEQLNLQIAQIAAKSRHHETVTHAMRRSMSWRVSAPVRWVGIAARTVVRLILSVGLRTVRRFPSLKKWVRAASRFSPALQRRLGLYAQASTPPVGTPSPQPPPPVGSPPNSTPGSPLVTVDDSFAVRLIYSNIAKASQLRRSV